VTTGIWFVKHLCHLSPDVVIEQAQEGNQGGPTNLGSRFTWKMAVKMEIVLSVWYFEQVWLVCLSYLNWLECEKLSKGQ